MAPHPMAAVLRATPHRFPMLLIDRIDELTSGRHGVAVKAVSMNEFQAHGAPPGDRPLLPPTLIVDALGQLAIGVLSAGTEDRPAVWYLAAIDGMRFDRPASPGDLLRLEVTVERQWGSVSKVAGRATIEGQTVAEGVLLLSTGRVAEPHAQTPVGPASRLRFASARLAVAQCAEAAAGPTPRVGDSGGVRLQPDRHREGER